MSNNNNPFTDFTKAFMNPDFFTNATKNMPQFDLSSFSNIMKKNTEAITASNHVIAENIQSLAKKGSEILQHNFSAALESIKDTMSSTDVEQLMKHQHKHVKSALEDSAHHTKEIMDMTTKAMMEVVDTVSKHAVDTKKSSETSNKK